MNNRRNYYRILHVQSDAPTAVIKASYRTMMQRLKIHPDLGGDHAHAAVVNEAFATLSDPARRAEYDRQLGGAEQHRGQTVPAGQTVPPEEAPAAPGPQPGPPSGTPTCGFCGAACSVAAAEWPEGTCTTCESPLFPAKKHEAGDASRRAIGRIPRNMPMTFRRSASREQVWAGATEDLSLNGMGLLSQIELSIDERLKIECEFCSAVGVVKTVRPGAGSPVGGWQCGVEFLRLRIKRERGGLFSTVA